MIIVPLRAVKAPQR